MSYVAHLRSLLAREYRWRDCDHEIGEEVCEDRQQNIDVLEWAVKICELAVASADQQNGDST